VDVDVLLCGLPQALAMTAMRERSTTDHRNETL